MLLNIEQDPEGKRVAADYESTNIRRSVHFPDSNQLLVEFVKGGKYVYSPVVEAQHRSMMLAPSPGGYFVKNIKNNSSINFRKVSDESEIVITPTAIQKPEEVETENPEA